MVTIGTLNGGNITITTGSSAPASHPETRFTLEGGTVETWNITGTLTQGFMSQNGYYDYNHSQWLKNITQADIGNTVTSIGIWAFRDCGLTDITMPNVMSIEAGAFQYCSGLTNVTIPDSTISIGGEAFANCSGLMSVTIGNGINRIAASAFATNASPITLTIGKTVAEVQAMGQTDYDYDTNVPYSEWGLPSDSTIVCTNGNITI